MYVREWAGRRDRVIVCLHAVGGSHAHWLGVAPRLAEHGWVLAPDLVGHGRTPRWATGAGLDAQQEALAELLPRTGPAVVIGSSFGGGVALLQAERHPESVSALILTGSLLPPFTRDEPPRASFAPYFRHRLRQRLRSAARRRPLSLARDAIVEDALRHAVADPRALDPELVASIVASQRDVPFRELASVLAQAGRSTFGLLSRPAEFAALLGRISCPVLLAHGGRDRTIPCAFAIASARLHPEWRLHVFENLGHLPHLEDAPSWLAVVEPWLEARCYERVAIQQTTG